MKPIVTLLLACLLTLAGCQSLSDNKSASSSGYENLPASAQGKTSNAVFLSAQHCLSEYMSDQSRIHFGPCLKIVSVDGDSPQVRDDGFIELPAATPATIGTSCVYRHADGSPIPATMETTDFHVTQQMFTEPGKRWYLHANKKARQVIGCDPTLSRSTSPTETTN
ncbi:hypothetical protein SAMN04488490_4130 [Marinobacter sp. LV10R510-11A]|uniref:hypothetical protein n=1 Tax=Marinobacter sp. LV10R510-11A TaxID=1415568 RepID=UPI000BB86B3D|nr:hypothetical protein [Marinobacter sp. LV10R510-11A]SOB78266.1 hypothetical protein SAMN04488490_4130 [Marinobacter sp. LV10R510-11A]